MSTQKAWIRDDSSLTFQMGNGQPGSSSQHSAQHDDQKVEERPWAAPRTIIQQNERDCYEQLKDRLAQIPSRSRQKRQSLYIDLWTGQHWLGITLTYPEGYEILKPVSVDTALSVATIGSYKLLNQPLFEDRQSAKLPAKLPGRLIGRG